MSALSPCGTAARTALSESRGKSPRLISGNAIPAGPFPSLRVFLVKIADAARPGDDDILILTRLSRVRAYLAKILIFFL